MTNDSKDAAPGAAIINPLHHRQVDFSLTIPGSKSMANRALLLAGAAEGESILDGVSDSDDIDAALSALSGLGVEAAREADGRCRICGRGLRFPVQDGDIDIHSSGTVGRFLPGLLAAAPSGRWRIVATEQLAGRPLGPLLTALRAWGADVERESGDFSFPLLVRGGGLDGGEAEISAAASSQFASGILMAAPLARKSCLVTIRELDPEECYIDMTLDLLRRFGVESESAKSGTTQTVAVAAPQRYRGANMAIEADYNSALYFLALPLAVGGRATVANLAADSGQPGRKFLAVLERLGGSVSAGSDGVSVVSPGGVLRGGFSLDMRAMSEMALTLGVLSLFADAPVTMTNLQHIRGHETDRLAVLASTLAAVGARCELGPDWITVNPLPRSAIRNTVIDSHADHRLAMSFALLALGANGLTITNPGAVAKTFPDFFQRLSSCGAEITYS